MTTKDLAIELVRIMSTVNPPSQRLWRVEQALWQHVPDLELNVQVKEIVTNPEQASHEKPTLE